MTGNFPKQEKYKVSYDKIDATLKEFSNKKEATNEFSVKEEIWLTWFYEKDLKKTCVREARPFQSFPNLHIDQLKGDLEIADDLKVQFINIRSPKFHELRNNGEEFQMKWAYTTSGKLLVIPFYAEGTITEIKHSYITRGLVNILAAGQIGYGSLTHYSGHYQPTEDTIEIGKRLFRKLYNVNF